MRTDVAVVGAGPYGLSLAAHLRGLGIDFHIIGRPMDLWRDHMPEGMLLKSDGFASNLDDPACEYPLERFCRERGVAYDDKAVPVRLETFVEYGLAFAKRFLPDLRETLVASLDRDAEGFTLRCDDGGGVHARRVVIAAGVGPFRHMPPVLSELGPKHVSHSYDHHELGKFAGNRVAVVGAGASAIDLAGLLRDHDCDVDLICRADHLKFGGAPSGQAPPAWQKTWSNIRHPESGLGPGWRSRLSTDAPLLFHGLHASLRLPIVKRHLGPAASFRMREKIEGRVRVLSAHDVVVAALDGDQVKLRLRKRNGDTVSEFYDHVIAGTGYRVDVDRLDFIVPRLRGEIDCIERTPRLSRQFESSVKGLYFMGPAAANCFGPVMRFAFGAKFAARRVAKALRASTEAASYRQGKAAATPAQ